MSEPLVVIGRPASLMLEPVRDQLQKSGYRFDFVDSASEALEHLADSDSAAVLVDIATPEVNGIRACGSIRHARREATIIALNLGESARRQAALEAGADLVLDDPVNWLDVQNWLRAPRAANGRILAEGRLLGQTQAENIGSASLLSHDLKSPISVIVSSLEVMMMFQEEDGASESSQKLLTGALNAAYRQLNMVSNIVDLARLEMDNYDLQLAELDLIQVVRDGLEAEDYALGIKGLDVTLDLPDEPLHVVADLELMQRVMSAMVDSVIKFTIKGDEFHVSVRREGDQAVLRFKDTGRSIDPGFEKDIMTRAPQWERRQAGARTSVGLSLPFVYVVAQAHKGDFTAESSDKYTIFTLTLRAM